MPKEYIEAFANGSSIQMTDFRELVIYNGGKR